MGAIWHTAYSVLPHIGDITGFGQLEALMPAKVFKPVPDVEKIVIFLRLVSPTTHVS